MKVRILVGLSGPEYSLKPNDTYEFPNEEAVRLFEAGYAVPFAEPKIERAVAIEAPERRKGRARDVVASDNTVANDGAGDAGGSEASLSDIA